MRKLIQFIATKCELYLTQFEFNEVCAEQAILKRQREYLELRGRAARAAFELRDYLGAPLRTLGRKFFAFNLTAYAYLVLLAVFMQATPEGRLVFKSWVDESQVWSRFIPLLVLIVVHAVYLCYRLFRDHSGGMILVLSRFVRAHRHGWMWHRTFMCSAGLWIGREVGLLASHRGMHWDFCCAVAILIFLAFVLLAICTIRGRK